MVGRLALACAVSVAAAGVPAGQKDPARYAERVDVTRIVIDARAIDGKGTALTDLGKDDFAVRIGGKPARIESVEWIPSEPITTTRLTGFVEPPADRLTVFLLQKSFEGSRLTGLMRLLLGARDFLSQFGARDRIAVLSFDYHLELWQDFTTDRERVRRVMERALVDPPPSIEPGASPSLLDRLSLARARRASTIEEALQLVGEALEGLPGAKSVVLIGYGFGRLDPGSGSVHMERRYGAAQRALQAARASVFCLDVTDADYHSLEAGLQIVAAATGGFFARTHLFQERAFNRLSGALSGYYVLFVERPDLKRGTHRVEVTLTRRDAHVLARGSWEDGP